MPESFIQRSLGSAQLVLPEHPEVRLLGVPGVWRDQHMLMQLMMDYYKNDGLYQEVARKLYEMDEWTEAMKGLRNPASRIVETYVDQVWSGRLQDVFMFESGSKDLQKVVRQIWTWSNWQSRKDLLVRQLAIYGNNFIKVEQPPDRQRVYLRLIDPRIVTEFKHDERDFLTYIRMDQQLQDPDNRSKTIWRTEIWDKDRQDVRIWTRDYLEEDSDRLGEPDEQADFAEFGINFIPLVHIRFRDIGEEWGVGPYTLLRDKIDEVNRSVTRLHEMLFRYNKAFLLLSGSGLDASSAPLPAPEIAGTIIEDGGFKDDDVFQAGADTNVEMLVPNLHYKENLDVAMSTLTEIEKDAPELRWDQIATLGDRLSSPSARIMLGSAIKRLTACRIIVEEALIRADQMAITIGQFRGVLDNFPDLGSFDDGDLEHSFESREMIPLSEIERAQADQASGQAATYWQEVHIRNTVIAERIGFQPGDVDTEAVQASLDAAKQAAKPPPPPSNPSNTRALPVPVASGGKNGNQAS
jgi:hypothetical protein